MEYKCSLHRALEIHATRIGNEMKIAVAHAIAAYNPHPTNEYILPSVIDRRVTQAVATAVSEAWKISGAREDVTRSQHCLLFRRSSRNGGICSLSQNCMPIRSIQG